MPELAWRFLSGCAASADALTAPILILGAPRSGTTWLAKIIDSHPDVLYRHEPDEMSSVPLPTTPNGLRTLIADWANDRSPRTVTKQPFFPKSWQPGWARALRTLLVALVHAAARLPPPFKHFGGLRIPDFAARPAAHLAIKSIRWAQDAAILARMLPDSRTIFIIRHPCGQVASIMRGARRQRFDLRSAGTDMPFDEAAAMRFAALAGIGADAFRALHDAAKYAWSWRAFNEPTYAALASRSNVHVVVYEALCAQPEVSARQILSFASLDWNHQTEAFVAHSATFQGNASYYAVLRNAADAAAYWHRTMPIADQAAVRSVVAGSPLARFWPGLPSTI